ncbi:MAG TPA: NAD(+) diphosphatase [Candidatus Nanopelagicales bacterium]|nr:NAD(+) diphosphatase [Candidatus Nanopelagicales bacterium]
MSDLLASLTLARGGIDRAAERRSDAAWFDGAWNDPATRVLVLHRGRARVRGDADARLMLVAPDEVEHEGVRVLLAVQEGTAYVGLLVDGSVEPFDEGETWQGLREVGALLSGFESSLMVAAVALANWHATHPRCPRCGVPTTPSDAGWSRRCPDDDSQHFPRSDPAVIVLVVDDEERALLGRRAEWEEGWYSTLAGFVEAGESAEMAVSREMLEEAGVHVDRLDYLGSQPWPFPASLMLGYHARVAPGSPAARPDGEEITALRWFTREEMAAGCEDGSVRIPPSVSIARRLIERWYGAELPGSWSRP